MENNNKIQIEKKYVEQMRHLERVLEQSASPRGPCKTMTTEFCFINNKQRYRILNFTHSKWYKIYI